MYTCELDCDWGNVYRYYFTIDDSQKFRFRAKSIEEAHQKATKKIQQLARELLRDREQGYEVQSRHFTEGTCLSIKSANGKERLLFFLNETVRGLRKIIRVGHEICWIDSRLIFNVFYQKNDYGLVMTVLNIYPTYLKRYKKILEKIK